MSMNAKNFEQDSDEFLKQDQDVIAQPGHSAAELRALPRPSFEDAALRFLARYQSHETRRTYGTTLRELQSFIAQRNSPRPNEVSHSQSAVDLALISEEDLLEFRRAIEENHRIKAHATTVRRVQTTIARKISTLRSFFAFAARRGFIKHNPAEHLDAAPVLRQSKTKALEPRELGAILTGLEAAKRNAETLRKRNAASLSYAVIVTLATTGLRVSELCKLKRADFLWSGHGAPGELTISRKGGKIQRIYLHPLTTATIQDYISHLQKKEYLDPHSPLFLRTQDTSSNGQLTHLTPKAVWNMVVQAARVAGIKGKLPSPHSLRASLATELHRQGVVLHEIQDLLGHSSPETTALYVKKLKQSAESPSLKIKVT
jgi:site-specific recombinase XerD